MKKSYFKPIFFLLILTGILPLLYKNIKNILVLKQKAQEFPFEIVIDGASPKILNKFWKNYAQGGEEKEKMLQPVNVAVTELEPQYIRIDHIFDFYSWDELDERIEEILQTGAIPFLSLSYMPPFLSSDGSITFPPSSYLEWQNLVQKTIERYSGKNGKNIQNIYYEVWNEPDVFGKMRPEDYFLLYQYAEKGATTAKEVNPFKLGGPATLGINKNWMNNFLGLVIKNNLRFDFISWHSYSKDPKSIKIESSSIDNLPNFAPFLGKVEKIVSEWGSDSEISSVHDTYFDASHTIASILESFSSVDKVFAFELKDGPNPHHKQFWGRWGLLTHQDVGGIKKPRYFAFRYLNRLEKFILPVRVENNIYVLTTTDGAGNFKILLTSYPNQGGKTTNFILKITNFSPGEFKEEMSFLGPQGNFFLDPAKIKSIKNVWEKAISLTPYSSTLIELKRISAATTKAQGYTQSENDYSAQIVPPLPPLVYPVFENFFQTNQNGEIFLMLKPFWAKQDTQEYYFFETKATPTSKIYALRKSDENYSNIFEFVIEKDGFPKSLSIPVENWETDKWHQFNFGWDSIRMEFWLKVDEKEKKETLGVLMQPSIGKFIFIGSDSEFKKQINGNIDNLVIKLNDQVVVEEDFN